MSTAESIVIRPCRASDIAVVAGLAAQLVREHHAADPARFMISERVEEGYAAFLKGELRNRESVVLVAIGGDSVLGYA